MYCRSCGVEQQECSIFCWKCGASVQSQKNQTEEVKTTTLGFLAFQKRKAEERCSKFQKKKNMKSTPSTSKANAVNEEVNINVGFIKFEDDMLKKCRGRTLPVKVPITADKKTILERAVRKHANHYKDVHDSGVEYTLLYPDGRQIVYLPGTTEEFVLKKYKEDLGKNYNRITIFIANKAEFLFSEISELADCINPDSPVNEDDVTSVNMKVDEGCGGVKKISDPSSSIEKIQNKDGETSSNSLPTQYESNRPSTSAEHYGECPTCFEFFPLHSIAEHADQCVDVWIGEAVEEDLNEEVDPVPLSEKPVADIVPREGDAIGNGIDVKEIVRRLAGVHLRKDEPRRINMRRKNFWSDYKQAREKWNLMPSMPVRVVMLGEPAIDDGGPKREFLSGK